MLGAANKPVKVFGLWCGPPGLTVRTTIVTIGETLHTIRKVVRDFVVQDRWHQMKTLELIDESRPSTKSMMQRMSARWQSRKPRATFSPSVRAKCG